MSAFIGGVTDFPTPIDLLAVIALGLLAGQRGRRFPVLVLIALAAGLFVGSFAVATGVGENPAAIALLALAAIGAASVIAALALPAWIAALLAFAIGAALPLNAPPHAITIAGAIAAQAGFAVAGLATFAAVSLIAMNTTRPWQRIGLRIVGSWIAASAILVLALRLAR
jgi:urease accessory protein